MEGKRACYAVLVVVDPFTTVIAIDVRTARTVGEPPVSTETFIKQRERIDGTRSIKKKPWLPAKAHAIG